MTACHHKSLIVPLLLVLITFAHAQSSSYDEFANAPFTNGFLSKEAIASLRDELALPLPMHSTSGACRE